jgi:hypothetical protein
MKRFSMIANEVIDRVLGLCAFPGDRLDVSPVQASVLMRKRLARFTTKADEPPPAPPEPEPEVAVIPYHNFDAGLDITLGAATQEPAKPVRRRRRAYQTREMTAE